MWPMWAAAVLVGEPDKHTRRQTCSRRQRTAPKSRTCCPSIQPSELELNETAKRCLRRPAAAVCGTFRPRRRSHAWLSAASAACLSGHPFPGMGVQLSTNALVRSTSSRKTLSPVVSECRRCQACLSSV